MTKYLKKATVLVSFLIAVLNPPDKSNLKEKGLLWFSFRLQAILSRGGAGCQDSRDLRQLVILYPQSKAESYELMLRCLGSAPSACLHVQTPPMRTVQPTFSLPTSRDIVKTLTVDLLAG